MSKPQNNWVSSAQAKHTIYRYLQLPSLNGDYYRRWFHWIFDNYQYFMHFLNNTAADAAADADASTLR